MLLIMLGGLVGSGACVFDRSGLEAPSLDGQVPADGDQPDVQVGPDVRDAKPDAEVPVCGNGVRETGEPCDGADLGGQTCQDFGYGGGTLACTPGCAFNTAGCDLCGNDTVDTSEACDGPDLNGQTCSSLGLTAGVLSCDADCAFDTSGCYLCGDGLVEGQEECDGTNLAGEDCQSQWFDSGTLSCLSNCSFDLSGCATCGNGIKEPSEVCDSTDLGGADCASIGYHSGTLACDALCQQFDVSGCATCGDGVMGGTEECDNGSGNSNVTPDACRLDCRLPWCGDGVCDSADQGQVCPQDCTAVVFTEDFEGTWPGLWQTGDNDGGSGTDTWGPVDSQSHSSSHSLQCAEDGSHTIFTGYDNNMQAWASYPVDLTVAAGQQVTLELWVWYQTDSGADFFQVGQSIDGGSNWTALSGQLSGDSGGWQLLTYDISAAAGNANYRIGLYFESNGFFSLSAGAFVDDIRITRTW